MERLDLKQLCFNELEDLAAREGKPGYRARQLAGWVFRKGAVSFDEMTDLSKEYRKSLETSASITSLKLVNKQVSSDGTEKFLFGMEDGEAVESVLIPEGARRTLCVSTQAGCKLACSFCNTGMHGFRRNLSPAEIVDQLIRAPMHSSIQRVSNLVLMGMGEPLDNFDNVIRALHLITQTEYQLVGARKITVSTAGLVPGIERLGREFSKVKLAVSVNAGDDATRERIMPVNRKYPLTELARALAAFPLARGRRITLEYVLLPGVNDSKEQAMGLASFARKFPSKINLIPFNPAPGVAYRRPTDIEVERFRMWLINKGLTAIVRDSKGPDIMAACGQLAHDRLAGEYEP